MLLISLILLLIINFPHLAKSLGIHHYQINRLTSSLSPSNHTQQHSNHTSQLHHAIIPIPSPPILANPISNFNLYLPHTTTHFIFSIIPHSFPFIRSPI
ncbi:FtsW/RodA/SpoVE family cell cycle protein, partial [Bacillus subtilis]|uniref:FtsW/RodA/SpoVE family cell cycle protein n=1 Tax=Bacillus subtilis TaxID=1423 RepID=UPI00338EED4B